MIREARSGATPLRRTRHNKTYASKMSLSCHLVLGHLIETGTTRQHTNTQGCAPIHLLSNTWIIPLRTPLGATQPTASAMGSAWPMAMSARERPNAWGHAPWVDDLVNNHTRLKGWGWAQAYSFDAIGSRLVMTLQKQMAVLPAHQLRLWDQSCSVLLLACALGRR